MKSRSDESIGGTTSFDTPPVENANKGINPPPSPPPSGVADWRKDYWEKLVDAALKAQDDWDKTIITLASASLGISISFVKDIAGDCPRNLGFLQLAWFFWAFSLIVVLVSFGTSYWSHRHGLAWVSKQTADKPLPPGVIPSGFFNIATHILNALSSSSYVAGLTLFLIFVIQNWI